MSVAYPKLNINETQSDDSRSINADRFVTLGFEFVIFEFTMSEDEALAAAGPVTA